MSAESREGAGSGTVLLAFVAGAAVGAVAALLLAPRSGADTRQRIAGVIRDPGARARRARRSAVAAADAARNVFEEALRAARSPAE